MNKLIIDMRRFGHKHSEETKRKIGLSNKGNKRPDQKKRWLINNPMNNPILKEKARFNRIGKGTGKNNGNYNPKVREKKKHSLLNFYKNHPESIISKRKKRLQQIKQVGGKLQIGKNETIILDDYEKIWGFKIIRQYEIPELGYIVDGYIPELNLCIEIDEPYHNLLKQKTKDIIRQKQIENKINCGFIRITDGFNLWEKQK